MVCVYFDDLKLVGFKINRCNPHICRIFDIFVDFVATCDTCSMKGFLLFKKTDKAIANLLILKPPTANKIGLFRNLYFESIYRHC